MDQPGMVANPARGQLKRENVCFFSPSLVAPENLVSRDRFDRPVPRPASACSFSARRLNLVCLLAGFLPLSVGVHLSIYYLYHQPPSGQSRVYDAPQVHTDGVHCRESAGTGPVVLIKVVLVTGAALAESHHGPINVRLSFPTPAFGMKWLS